ncbi:MAG: glycerate kinase [Deltaproteobacteria bacterium]|nr:glycerate kinase [Deltaproteobacteria bacterium]
MKSLSELRQDAVSIFHSAVEAADPKPAIQRLVRRKDEVLNVDGRTYNLTSFDNIYVVGAGKASARMAQAIEGLIGDQLTAGIVNVKYGHGLPLQTIRVNEAGHPLPDICGVRGTQEILELSSTAGETDLVICLFSGGGSALLPCPPRELSLDEKVQVTKLLLDSGVSIHEINAVRKHLSQVKGGRLARMTYPATLISLILSDVVGDDLQAIACGPTAPDKTTFADCMDILARYSLCSRISPRVKDFLERGVKGQLEETPKPNDPVFQPTQNVIVGNNTLAVEAASKTAQACGYRTMILSCSVEGEAREVAKVYAAIARQILLTGHPVQRPACVVSGGETTVTVCGRGVGGRNQEFALAAAIALDGLDNAVILSAGTDGTDGATNAAGAVADCTTIRRANNIGLNAESHLRENDSHPFFQQLHDLIVTGPTLTNVMDLQVLLLA